MVCKHFAVQGRSGNKMNQLLSHKPKPTTSPFSRRVCTNSVRIVTLMAATLDRSRHDRAINSLRGRIVRATTLEELCLLLRFKKRETKVLLSLDVDLKTWRRLSQIQVLQMFSSSGLKGKLSVGTKIRFQDALFAEHIVLERIKNTTDECSLAQNMKCHYYDQAEDLDVTKDMCFASVLPDVRLSSANGFYTRRIAGYLGSGNNRPSAGIIFGDHCIQIGNFRLGCMPAGRAIKFYLIFYVFYLTLMNFISLYCIYMVVCVA